MIAIISFVVGLAVGFLLGFYFAPAKIEEVEVPVEKIVEKVVYVDKSQKPSNKKKKKVVSPEVTA